MSKSAIVAKSTRPPLAAIVSAANRASFVLRLPARADPESTRKLTSRALASSVGLTGGTSVLGVGENHAVNHTRDALQRVATHVLARARHAATGRFGLRATPGGFGTPAFGDAVEVLRVSRGSLLRERDGHASSIAIDGATLRALAAFADADLTVPFEAGHDTPPLGDIDAPLRVDVGEAVALAAWWHLGWQAIDAAVADQRDAMAIQLWPEHFDAGTSVAVGDDDGDRCNLGVSPGDGFSDEPYLYVGPWTDRRPGDESYWNAPFGAVLMRHEVEEGADALSFFRRGLDALSGGRSG